MPDLFENDLVGLNAEPQVVGSNLQDNGFGPEDPVALRREAEVYLGIPPIRVPEHVRRMGEILNREEASHGGEGEAPGNQRRRQQRPNNQPIDTVHVS